MRISVLAQVGPLRFWRQCADYTNQIFACVRTQHPAPNSAFQAHHCQPFEFLPEKRALFGADVFVFNKVVAQYADAARYESE